MRDFIKGLLAHFRSNGLNHSLSHLKAVQDDVINYPLDKMAKYADAVCTNLVSEGKEHEFINVGEFKTEWDFLSFNATSLGNMAYIALNSKDSAIRTYCLDTLVMYRRWKLSQSKKTVSK